MLCTAHMGSAWKSGCQRRTRSSMWPAAVQMHYIWSMKTAAIPQIRVHPELREAVDAALGENETVSEFVEEAVRRAVEYRRVQTQFLERGEAAWQAFQQTGQAVEADSVLDRLQVRLDARRRALAKK